MSQVDNRNSSAAKRARTDGGRREDDWTCPSCGNVNFSFRTTCNMRNCTQSRPADHNSKSAVRPMHAPQSYSPSAAYVGSGAPSSMYMGVTPYGGSLFNGPSMPAYDVPFAGGSAYHYNFGSRLSGGSPYRPVHLSAPPPYTGGMGNGGMYGVPPLMDRYGLALPMAPSAMAPRPGFYPDDNSQKKDGTRDNDWTCPKCGNVNFSFRTVCNMRKCNTPKPGSQVSKSVKNTKPDTPDGSWKCEKCNNINYPFRTKCNRQNCGAEKPAESKKSPSQSADENDQKNFSGVIIETDSLGVSKMIKREWKVPWQQREEVQQIQEKMQQLNAQIQHVFREGNQLADKLANEACDQQRKIIADSEMQMSIACKGILKTDRMQIPMLRIRARKIIIGERAASYNNNRQALSYVQASRVSRKNGGRDNQELQG